MPIIFDPIAGGLRYIPNTVDTFTALSFLTAGGSRTNTDTYAGLPAAAAFLSDGSTKWQTAYIDSTAGKDYAAVLGVYPDVKSGGGTVGVTSFYGGYQGEISFGIFPSNLNDVNYANSFGLYTPSGGSFIPLADNQTNLGRSSFRWKDAYFSGTITAADGTLTGTSGASTLTINGATQTASFPALSISQTWNNAAVTFTGVKANITNAASGASSMLMDLQVGGSTKFYVQLSGAVNSQSTITATANIQTSQNLWMTTNSGTLFWGASNDVALARDAANVLAQRNGTNAQTARWYNTYTDSSNYERGYAQWSGNNFQIGTESAGTGTARGFALLANGSYLLQSNASSLVLSKVGFSSSAAGQRIDVGNGFSVTATSGSFADMNFTGVAAPTATSTMVFTSLRLSPVINYSNVTPGAGSYEALKIAVTETALPTGTSYLIRASAGATGSTDMFAVRRDGYAYSVSGFYGGSGSTAFSGSTLKSLFGPNKLAFTSDGVLSWAPSTTYSNTGDVINVADLKLQRDAANTLAQRNSTSAQTFNIYNTYTDASNYERGVVGWSGNAFVIGTQAAGTGTQREITLTPKNTVTVDSPTSNSSWLSLKYSGTEYIKLGLGVVGYGLVSGSVYGSTSSVAVASGQVRLGGSSVTYETSSATYMTATMAVSTAPVLKLHTVGLTTKPGLSIESTSAQTADAIQVFSDAGITKVFSVSPLGTVTLNAADIVTDSTTGTKFGTATTQKLGFWNATPIVQPTTAVASATRVAGVGASVLVDDTYDGYTLAQIVKALRNAGLLA